jgi:hypothetical protein
MRFWWLQNLKARNHVTIRAKTPLVVSFETIAEQNWKNTGEMTQRMYTPRFVDQWVMSSTLAYTQAMPSEWVVEAAVNAIVRPGGVLRVRAMVRPSLLLWFICFQETLSY